MTMKAKHSRVKIIPASKYPSNKYDYSKYNLSISTITKKSNFTSGVPNVIPVKMNGGFTVKISSNTGHRKIIRETERPCKFMRLMEIWK